jgi:hypothetical protein
VEWLGDAEELFEWREPEWELEMYNFDVAVACTKSVTYGEVWDKILRE